MRSLLLSLLLVPAVAMAQVPQAFEFQGIARDVSGNILSTQSVGLRLGVIAGSPTGTLTYQETHAAVTSPLGLFTVQVGNGTPVVGTFAGVDWSSGPHYMKVELDPAVGNNYQLMGTTQMLSVPYALVAGRTACLSVSLLGDTLRQSSGCYVIIPGLSLANGGCRDTDGDGVYDLAGCSSPPDCNDNNAMIYPGATEVCDGVDNNCDGQVDEGFALGTDPLNCGACGTVCALPNATAACVSGVCQIGTCNAGFADCDGDPMNGCETDLLNSTSNCGTCGTPCTFPNASAVCVNGACQMGPCDAGYANCDGNTANGCETHVLTSTANCGACGTPCILPNATTACVNGTCQIAACNSGFADCDGNAANGCETNLLTDVSNCGSCGQSASDGLPCTADVCVSGVISHPPLPAGTACGVGGSVCNGAGTCVAPPVPQVMSVSPTNGGAGIANSTIAITFNTAMNPATLTTQTNAGACSGSVQCSLDNFATCIAFSSASVTMSGGNTVATVTPAPGMLVNRAYRVRVTTAAQNGSGAALSSTFTQATGFTTTSPNLGNGSVVISQVYGGGGASAGTPNADYVELHNRGTSAVNLTNWSIQYADATGTTWSVIGLAGSIAPGGYHLVRTQAPQGTGTALPTPDVAGTTIDINASAGKVALVSTSSALSGACPTGTSIRDLVGYGATANCREGNANAPAPGGTTALFRAASACADANDNGADMSTAAPSPRNSSTAAVICSNIVNNESNLPAEVDYCAVSSPASLSTPTGTTTQSIFGQIYEAGVTESFGPHPDVRAQVGYGLPTANPQYENWTWVNATYNTQSGSNDEYIATFVAPAAGSYRYAYRFSLDQGVSWTVCDAATGDFGAGANFGLSLEFSTLPVLTVTP